MAVELGGMNTGLNKSQTIIHTRMKEYSKLPAIYPFEKGYKNNIAKIIEAIINVTKEKELPRDLILGWDAYQQFQQSISVIKAETEKLKALTVAADAGKRDLI